MARSALRKPANRTVAVFGAPGAGKSALLTQLIEQYGSQDSQVLPVRISASSMNPLGVFDAVARAVGISRRGETVPATQVDAEAKIMGVGGGVKSTSLQRQASDRAEIQAVGGVPWELMRDRLGATVRGRVVLLLCDEAQVLKSHHEDVQDTVRGLHLGPEGVSNAPPIVPVFAGLNDTVDVLRQCGVTRITMGNKHALGALAESEREEYALKVLAHLAHDSPSSGEQAGVARWIVNTTDGWPQHMRLAMEAVAVDMLRVDDEQAERGLLRIPTPRDLDWGKIGAKVVRLRNGFYNDRLSASGYGGFGDVLATLAADAEDAPGGVPEGVLMDIADGVLARRNRAPSGEELVNGAIHAGVLQQIKDSQNLTCPIPSMRSWLRTRTYNLPELPEFDGAAGGPEGLSRRDRPGQTQSKASPGRRSD